MFFFIKYFSIKYLNILYMTLKIFKVIVKWNSVHPVSSLCLSFFCRADNKQCSSFCEPENSISDIEVAEVAYNVEDD